VVPTVRSSTVTAMVRPARAVPFSAVKRPSTTDGRRNEAGVFSMAAESRDGVNSTSRISKVVRRTSRVVSFVARWAPP